MKKVILEQIEKIGKSFLKDLMSVEDKTLLREKDKEKEISELQGQSKNLKEQQRRNEQSLQASQSKLTEAVESQKKAISDLNNSNESHHLRLEANMGIPKDIKIAV